ncbi:MAG: transcriptional repressor [Deltaproteobacteria bacterium]|nr:transcriptional repressor [Deltaproteobacteria bacterium]
MTHSDQIQQNPLLRKLKIQGYRLTKVRQFIVDLLANSQAPVSLSEIKENLTRNNIRADRTTIYREVIFLKGKKMICEIPVGGSKRGYKVCQDVHHHHLICVRCNKVEPMVFKKPLLSQENEISQRKDFKVLDHLLEFYGLCGDCQ